MVALECGMHADATGYQPGAIGKRAAVSFSLFSSGAARPFSVMAHLSPAEARALAAELVAAADVAEPAAQPVEA